MGALIMLLLLVIVVATTATVVTLLVMRAVSANNPRLHLPPPPRRPSPPQAVSGAPGSPFPRYPALRLSAADRERIMVLLRAGQKIHAIKLYREVTGAGLREAKDAVDHMERYQ